MELEIAQPLLPQPDLIFDGLPFTRAEGRANDLDAKKIRRLLRLGLLRAVVRGVYVDSLVEDSLPLRAAAVAKVAPPDSVVCRQAAAWLFGIDTLALSEHADVPKVDFVRQARTRAVKIARANGHSQTLLEGDVIDWHGLRVTSPLATAVHLARHLPRPFALSALDAMARAELITRTAVQDGVLGLEYDSDRWHGTAEQQQHDAVRRARLKRLGWDIISVGRWQIWGEDTSLEDTVGKILGVVPLARRW
jgi:hypothetical protein